MAKSLLFFSRVWHRRISAALFVFFFIVAATGLMLGWKSLFTTTVFEDKKAKASTAFGNWLPLDSLERLAASSLEERVPGQRVHAGSASGLAVYAGSAPGLPVHAERAEVRIQKGYIDFQFKNYYYVQVDGGSGRTIRIEHKNGGWIQDLHDGAIVDGWLTNKWGISKKLYSSVIALALLALTISGIYLWYKPLLLKKRAASR
ncbi:MAG TPA: PepSY-associated TM helix domain-containing protein [Puia sp.]|nr:PepSY-associated TM helix domain-containing protein [Puia sp.]